MASDTPSSPAPAFKTVQEEIAYYKTQYEQLESELQDFQNSSKELEAELEKDIEASEKRERTLKEKVESLKYEAEEWKTKYKQAKTEGNAAQNALQKEITALRDSNRTLQLRLRDIEVANDDFERQARNTTSSLEDMESKYNQTIERGVMLEEEMKSTELEREQLRIEAQRLREELSDLKIEQDITLEKLRASETSNGVRLKRISQLSGDTRDHNLVSPSSEAGDSLISVSTPAADNESSVTGSEATTPPSPPLSDLSAPLKAAEGKMQHANSLREKDPHLTPRPSHLGPGRSRHTRGLSLAALNGTTPAFSRSAIARPRPSGVSAELPRSGSLYQIRGLIGKMQKLEQRVQSARSKLPAPTNTPPRASPRAGAATPVHQTPQAQHPLANSSIPSNITMRSRKRSSMTSSAMPSRTEEENGSRLGYRSSRISVSNALNGNDESRPSSRTSNISASQYARPASRTSQLPEPIYSTRPASAAESRRPRSSLAGNYPQERRQELGLKQSQSWAVEGKDDFRTPTATIRRTTGTGLPTPGSLMRRQSAQVLGSHNGGQRKSIAAKGSGGAPRESMGPPSRPNDVEAVNEDLGETW